MFLIGRHPAQHLLDRGGSSAGVGDQALPLVGMQRGAGPSPPVITWRVVSSPPMRISSDSWMISSSSRRSPSTSACTRMLIRSSLRLGAPGGDDLGGVGVYSPKAFAGRLALRVGGLAAWPLSMSSDQRSRSSRSSGATPSMSPIMIIGRGAAMSLTKSHSPCSHTASMISSARLADLGSLSRTRRGVKPRLTSLRRCRCSGSSMSIIIGSGRLSGRMPPALREHVGSLATRLHVGVAGDAPHVAVVSSTGALARIQARAVVVVAG